MPVTARPWSRARWASGLSRLLPYGGVALILLAMQRSQLAEALNLLLYDMVSAQRPAASAQRGPVTLVGLEEGDIQRYGWPLDDSLLCRGIDRLLQDGAAVVGLDLYRDKGVGPQQDCLRQRFRHNPRLVAIFNDAAGIRAVPGTPPERQGFNDLVLDDDGVVRRDLLHVGPPDGPVRSFPMQVVQVYRQQPVAPVILNRIPASAWLEESSGGYQRADTAGYQLMLPYRQIGSYPTVSLRALLAGQVPRRWIQGRIILIGSTAPSLRDLFPVPMTRSRAGASQLQVAGVELHANRVLALLDALQPQPHLVIRTTNSGQEMALQVLACLVGAGLGNGFRNLRGSVTAVLLMSLGLVAGTMLLLLQGVWMGLSLQLASLNLMAAVAWVQRGAISQRQRQQIEKLLGQPTAPALAQPLGEQREELLRDGRFQGRQLEVTILFSDMANFTTVSEGLAPGDLLNWLNRGMATSVQAISAHGGMVNKFTGDGFLAVFGAPLGQGAATDAIAAVRTAVTIREHLRQLNHNLEAEGQPAMRMRIGIHSGLVLAGSMGSSERLEYCVIGDTVNCASRLESLQKERHQGVCRILLSEVTHRLIGTDPSLMANLGLESWGELAVKGRQQPLHIWEVKDNAQAASGATPP